MTTPTNPTATSSAFTRPLTRRNFLATSAVGTGLALTAPALTLLTAGCSTSWITTVENDLPIIVGIANSILQVITTATGSGAIAATVGALISDAVTALSASLTALQNAIAAYQANTGSGLTKVIAALTSAQSDITKVIQSLPAGTVSPVVLTVIVAGIGTVITILSSIQALVPGASPVGVNARAVRAATTTAATMPNAASLKAGFNSVLMLNGYGELAIQ